MPEQPHRHIHWKFGFTYCNRVWQAMFADDKLPLCRTCENQLGVPAPSVNCEITTVGNDTLSVTEAGDTLTITVSTPHSDNHGTTELDAITAQELLTALQAWLQHRRS